MSNKHQIVTLDSERMRTSTNQAVFIDTVEKRDTKQGGLKITGVLGARRHSLFIPAENVEEFLTKMTRLVDRAQEAACQG